MNPQKSVIVLGAGGHARVLIDCLRLNHTLIHGITAPEFKAGDFFCEIPILGGDDYLKGVDPAQVVLVNGVGTVKLSDKRKNLYDQCKQMGFSFLTVIHPGSHVAKDALLEEGVQVMAGAVIQPGTHVGINTIINTQSSVDHDCRIGAHVHIAPGAVLCGDVSVGDMSFVGTRASIIQGIVVGKSAMVVAGAVVTRPVPEGVTVAGVPARPVPQGFAVK